MTLLHKGSKEGEHGTKMTEASGPSVGQPASATVSPLSPPHPSSSSSPSTTSSKSPDHIPHKRSNTYTFGRNLPFVPSVVTSTAGTANISSSFTRSNNSMDGSCSVNEVKKLIYEKSPSKVDCRVMDGEVVSFQDALHVAKLSKQVKKETTRSHVMES